MSSAKNENKFQLNRLLDISCVQVLNTSIEIDDMIDTAIKYNVKCVFTLPAMTEYTVKRLKDKPEINVGGVVGFPSGGETTDMKVMEARELRLLGCNEIDMVMNLTALASGMYDFVSNDISQVVKEAGDIPVKVIIESPSLTEDQIEKAVKICIDSGASFVKSSTGWQEKKTEVKHIEIMKKYAGDKIKIKAAGGVRNLSTIMDMYNKGCTRFGVNVNTAKVLLSEV